jgi:membrane protein
MPNHPLSRFKRLAKEAHAAFTEKGVDAHGEQHLTPFQKFLHFWVLVVRGFAEKRCPVRATALAYNTLLAMIPLLALAFSVSSSLLKSEDGEAVSTLTEKIVEYVAPQLDLFPKKEDDISARERVSTQIQDYINNINSGTLGITGFLALIIVVILLLSTIETTFNDIWGVSRGRTWVARIVRYWATVTLGPLIPLLAMTINISSQFDAPQRWLHRVPYLADLVLFLIPFVVLSLAFALFYQLMPNTRVRWQAALIGGAVGGCLWQINSMLSSLFVSSVARYDMMYGSLGLLPVFLVGLYLSWLILLFGAQVAYTYQNRAAYFQERQAENINELGREFVALRLMTLIARHFQCGNPPPTAIGLAQSLTIPSRLVESILMVAVRSNLLLEAEGDEPGYVPRRPLEHITGHDILQAIRAGDGRQPETHADPTREVVQCEFHKILHAGEAAASALTLADLASRSIEVDPPSRESPAGTVEKAPPITASP